MHPLLRFLTGLVVFSLGFRLALLVGKIIAVLAVAVALLWFGIKGCGLLHERIAESAHTKEARKAVTRWAGR